MNGNRGTPHPTSPGKNTTWGATETVLTLAIAVLVVAIARTLALHGQYATELANTHCPSWNHVEWAVVGARPAPALGKLSSPGGPMIQTGGRWLPICSESITITGSTR